MDKVTIPVVLRNLHEYDNQLSDTRTGFDHWVASIALPGGGAEGNSVADSPPGMDGRQEWTKEASINYLVDTQADLKTCSRKAAEEET